MTDDSDTKDTKEFSIERLRDGEDYQVVASVTFGYGWGMLTAVITPTLLALYNPLNLSKLEVMVGAAAVFFIISLASLSKCRDILPSELTESRR